VIGRVGRAVLAALAPLRRSPQTSPGAARALASRIEA